MSVIEKSGVMKYKDKDGQVYIMLPITTADKVDGAVSFYEQELTEEEKAQARANIGAISADEVPESGGAEQVQSDYDQNDSTAVDFIKNRPFYDVSETIFDGDVTTELDDILIPGAITGDVSYEKATIDGIGHTYKVSVNDETYECMSKQAIVGAVTYYIGNYMVYAAHDESITEDMLVENNIEDTGEPFCIISDFDSDDGSHIISIIFTTEAGTYNLKVEKILDRKQLDEKFIPSTIVRASDIPTVEDIDAICGTSIDLSSEVKF